MATMTGIADHFPVKIFETNVNQVTAGTANGGWVSGTPANLVASAAVDVIFDLGQDWHQYVAVQVSVFLAGPSTGANPVYFTGSDTAAKNVNRRLVGASSASLSSIYANVTTSGSTQAVVVRPMGRYLTVTMLNADATNAMGATSKITMAAYPG